MKFFSAILLLTALVFTTNTKANEETSTGLKWYTNLDEVNKLSEETGKPIFGFFTGSDWCGWCIKLQKDVFAKQAFIDWANENVILLELDFPRKTTQTEELKTQNRNLQQAFQVTGYPTVWIFTAKKDPATANYNLTAWGKLGYPMGAVAGQEEVKFLADAEGVMANKPK